MKMRVALIGCGAVTEVWHLPAFAEVGVTPSVFIDRNLDRARKLAEPYPGAIVAGNYSECLDQFDAAIVAVPHALHAPICEDILKRGIHVLVEKPMANTSAECDRMIEAASVGKAVLAVGLFRRFRRIWSLVREILDSNILGPIQSVDFREGAVYDWPVASSFFFRKELSGGGVLMDTGAHTLDLLLWLFEDVKLIDYRDDALGGVEADCELCFELASGATGVVELSRTHKLRNTGILTGTKGKLEISLLNDTPFILDVPEPGQFALRITEALRQRQHHAQLFVLQLQDWLRAISQKAAPLVSGQEGRGAIRLIEECYKRRVQMDMPWTKWQEHASSVNGSPKLQGRRVAVTGATGFIGGRLVDRLLGPEGAEVRPLVRGFRKASRLARYPIEMIATDLSDAEKTSEATRDCDVVFHCAHDFADEASNLVAARGLAEACLRNGVRRLVYLSSVSAYDPMPDGEITEDTNYPQTDLAYTLSKRAVEAELLRLHRERGLPVVILQPTVVYGPFSTPWTDRPARRMRSPERFALPVGGVCNPVYVDDVVSAMLLATMSDKAVGNKYLISGPDSVTWTQFYAAYEEIFGVKKVVEFESEKLLSLIDKPAETAGKRLKLNPKQVVGDLLPEWVKETVKRLIGRRLWKRTTGSFPPPLMLPSKVEALVYLPRATVRIDRARKELGYTPAFTFAQGMEMTKPFVLWAYR